KTLAKKDDDGVFRYEPTEVDQDADLPSAPAEWFDTSTDPEIARSVALAEAAARGAGTDSSDIDERPAKPKPGVFDMVPESEGGGAPESAASDQGEERRGLPSQAGGEHQPGSEQWTGRPGSPASDAAPAQPADGGAPARLSTSDPAHGGAPEPAASDQGEERRGLPSQAGGEHQPGSEQWTGRPGSPASDAAPEQPADGDEQSR